MLRGLYGAHPVMVCYAVRKTESHHGSPQPHLRRYARLHHSRRPVRQRPAADPAAWLAGILGGVGADVRASGRSLSTDRARFPRLRRERQPRVGTVRSGRSRHPGRRHRGPDGQARHRTRGLRRPRYRRLRHAAAGAQPSRQGRRTVLLQLRHAWRRRALARAQAHQRDLVPDLPPDAVRAGHRRRLARSPAAPISATS